MGDVRDLGFVVWNDEFGDLEDMTGTPFKRACATENIQYKNTISEINEKTKQEWLTTYDSIKVNETIYHSFSWNKYEISVGGRKLYIEITGKGNINQKLIEYSRSPKFRLGLVKVYKVIKSIKLNCIFLDFSQPLRRKTFFLKPCTGG